MKVAITIITVLLGLFFLFAGGTKLAGQAAEQFAGWGYPVWFMYFTGVIEVLSGIMLLIPKTRLYGAVLIVCTMIGAIGTLVMAGQMTMVPVPGLVLVLAAFIAQKCRLGATA